MALDHDQIDLGIDVEVDVPTAWTFVSVPGWFVNDGRLSEHQVTWDGATATVVDPDHGEFRFVREVSEPPHHLADRGLLDGTAASRTVEFWVTARDGRVHLRVVESGFASLPVPDDEQRAQQAQNTATWRTQLELARAHLEGGSQKPGPEPQTARPDDA